MPAVGVVLCVMALVSRGAAQHCGTLGQAQICREDCGSCGAQPCCTLEWDLPQTSATAFASNILQIGEAWGPDELYRLEGHTPNYTAWTHDIHDDSPKSIQLIHTPVEWAADDYALSEDRVDQIAISIYYVTASSSRVVAFSQTKRATVPWQCDLGSNYKGLFQLISAANVPEYRERTLYGCMSREFGVIPPEVYPGYDPSTATPSTAFP